MPVIKTVELLVYQCDECLFFEQTVLAAVTRVLSERERVFTISPLEEREEEEEEGERSPRLGVVVVYVYR